MTRIEQNTKSKIINSKSVGTENKYMYVQMYICWDEQKSVITKRARVTGGGKKEKEEERKDEEKEKEEQDEEKLRWTQKK